MITGYKKGTKVILYTEGVPDMVDELRAMDGRMFVIEKYVTGRYYYLKGCVSKAGVPFAILPHWFRVVRDV